MSSSSITSGILEAVAARTISPNWLGSLASCVRQGASFQESVQSLLQLAQEDGIVFVMHNKAHEYYAFCRDSQKRDQSESKEFKTLLKCIRDGVCTLSLSRTFSNNGYPMKLKDAYQYCALQASSTLRRQKKETKR